jgi:DNA (cytosine-5)-methyltransferase 1
MPIIPTKWLSPSHLLSTTVELFSPNTFEITTFACVATITASSLPTIPRHPLARRYMQHRSMHHRSMPRHSHAMGSSRARPVLLLDDEDLDIVMEENGNGRLTELYNEPLLPFFLRRVSRRSTIGSFVPVIKLNDDEEDDSDLEITSPLNRSLRRGPQRDDDDLIELELIILDDDDALSILGVQPIRVEEVSQDNIADQQRVRRRGRRQPIVIERRNSVVAPPFKRLAAYKHRDLDLKPNKTVEVNDGTFLKIQSIIHNTQTNEIKIRGHRLQRTKELNGLLAKKMNEVVLCLEIELDDPRELLEQAVSEVSLDDITRLRNTRTTNSKFPLCRNTNPAEFRSKESYLLEGGLTARWKYTCTFASAAARYKNVFQERSLERFEPSECLENFRIHPLARRYAWRGETIPGGTYQGASSWNEAEVIDLDSLPISESPRLPQTIDLTQSELATPPDSGSIRSSTLSPEPPVVRTRGQKLTYGDAFCGAGGATRGAEMAGLRVVWGFDFWQPACASWQANFRHARNYCLHSQSFVNIASRAERDGFENPIKVDVLHLSPPCQTWSPAHSKEGKDDEMNVASLFAVQAVIEASKPRVVTLEQTFGILFPKFRWYFNCLIHMFTVLDFSIRWAIVPLSQWGLPQRRHRLIIIAACPGEILPKMPLPTHSEGGFGGLKPFVSVNETIAAIPRDAPNHDLNGAPKRSFPPWDGSKILPRAICSDGGQGNCHPSGKRDLTLREFASLQGFPLGHVFLAPYVKKQIGNAVPPCGAKVIFESIKEELDRADGIVEAPVLIE